MRQPLQRGTVFAAGMLMVVSACSKPGDTAQADSAGGGSAMAKMDSTGNTMAMDSAAAGNAAPAQPDAQSQNVLTTLAGLGGKPIETLTPAEARKQPTPTDAVMAILKKDGKPTDPKQLVPGVTAVDRSVGGAAGQIPATVYTPEGAGPFPMILYTHGGGWVIANRKVYDGGARGLAKSANAVVVSIDYRLAPEHKFPAAHDDAIAAYKWMVANAAAIKGDTSRIALAGESAGGNLALATAVAVRDQKLTSPKHIVAVYPVAQNDTTTASYNQYANAKPLNRPMISWFLKHTLKSPADAQDPRLNLVAANLRGLPPVTIINAEIDPLRDDGMMIERALRDAGVQVERRKYDGVTHEFFGAAAVVDKAKEAQTYAGDRLKASFGAAQTASR